MATLAWSCYPINQTRENVKRAAGFSLRGHLRRLKVSARLNHCRCSLSLSIDRLETRSDRFGPAGDVTGSHGKIEITRAYAAWTSIL